VRARVNGEEQTAQKAAALECSIALWTYGDALLCIGVILIEKKIKCVLRFIGFCAVPIGQAGSSKLTPTEWKPVFTIFFQ